MKNRRELHRVLLGRAERFHAHVLQDHAFNHWLLAIQSEKGWKRHARALRRKAFVALRDHIDELRCGRSFECQPPFPPTRIAIV